MEPLRIAAHMSEPVVYYGDGMHLDGILAWAKYADLTQNERAEMPPITGFWAWDFDLPLRTWSVQSITPGHIDDRLFINRPRIRNSYKEGALWGWRASAVHAEWMCEDRYAIRRRPEIEQMIRYTESPSVNLGAGQQKATNIRLPAKFALDLHWYAVGDIGEIRRLLDTHVRAIGKLTTKGPGRVSRWEVEPWPHDWSIMHNEKLTRTMPIGYNGALGYTAEASIRPPYHHSSRVVMAIRPSFEDLRYASA